ncbi:hypothetical protein GBF38_008723 [Nibea albiflora]|uniref:Uncharacterized protein n=1 Tax=Nibea albiflora TaxID=240163 RepID=A0ACB7ERJ0_NIBAL|nr:hypothetical protein GBF38_008723 [Nibea albiflora]
MQERQTQVLARPARAEGRDRETEGILEKVPLGGSPGSRQKSTVFPDIPAGSMQAALATQIHARRASRSRERARVLQLERRSSNRLKACSRTRREKNPRKTRKFQADYGTIRSHRGARLANMLAEQVQPPSHPPPMSVKSYLVSLGPPQRKEAGEEELAPADDGSQAPVEASHACVCPVSSASLLSPG